ncbi:MAG TPA: sigma-E factor regulatory protein RseB domain-containing protein [Natronosporangium sp.]
MAIWTRRPALRWLVPGVAAALVLGGGAAASAIAATQDDPDLPPRSAAELLVDLQTAQIGSVSGTVVTTANLGLPVLPGAGEAGNADLGSLWSGSNTLRVWYDGPERVRVALLDTLSQADIIRNGQDLWIWHSEENEASHWTLPDGFATEDPSQLRPPLSPQEAAERALVAIDPSTEVSTDETTRVAGRDAYELVLTPRDEASLVDGIRIAIDAEHSLPLSVQVFGEDPEPAFEVRFTQISFERPDPEQFEFNPPPGGTVTEQESLIDPGWFGEGFADFEPEFEVVGEGWTSVLVTRLPEEAPLLARLEPFLSLMPAVSGDWGSGHTISTALLSALITDDGRVLVGPVTPERLVEVAGDPAAALD